MTLDLGKSERWCLATKSRRRRWRRDWGRVDNGPLEEGEDRASRGLCVSIPGSGRPMSEGSVVYKDDCVEAKVM